MLLELLLFLTPLLTSAKTSWFNSTCPEPTYCVCTSVRGADCFIGNGSRPDMLVIECQDLSPDTVSLSVECEEFRNCDQVSVTGILTAFRGLYNLTLQKCKVDMSGIEIDTHLPPLKWSVDLGRVHGKTTQLAIYINAVVDGIHPNNISCMLTDLCITDARLYKLPIGLLSACRQLIDVALIRNDFTIINRWDFAVLTSLPYLTHLYLTNNYLTSLGSTFTAHAMSHISDFLVHDLRGWIEANNNSLSTEEQEHLHNLYQKFQDWSNLSSSLDTEELISFFVDSKALLQPILNNCPLQYLELGYNNFYNVPPEIVFLNDLMFLHINHNNMMNALNYRYQYFYNLNQSLHYMTIRHNVLITIQCHSFEYLMSLNSIDLSYNRIEYVCKYAIPSGANLRFLYINHNRLKTLDFANRLPNLQHVVARDNAFDYLGHGMTRNLPNLTTLILADNPYLRYVEDEALLNLTHLRYMDLRNNTITDMPFSAYQISRVYSKAHRLKIDIRYNNAILNCDCFSVFAKMQEELDSWSYTSPTMTWSDDQLCKAMERGYANFPLVVRKNHNFFCYVYGEFCPPNCNCCSNQTCPCRWMCPKKCNCYFSAENAHHTINCSDLNLDYVPQSSTDATIFTITNNRIDKLEPNSFSSKLKSLMSIHLEYNNISSIPSDVFDGLSNLKFLSFHENDISFIDENAFRNLSIATIYLSDNRLRSFYRAPFEKLKSLSGLYLRGNPLECNCESLLDFMSYKLEKDVYVDMPTSCRVLNDSDIQVYGEVDFDYLSVSLLNRTCAKVAQRRASARQRLQAWVIGGISGAAGVTLTLLLLLAGIRQRHALRAYLDARVASELGRSILSLTPYNMRTGIDVGFLVHERQTEQFYDIKRRLVGTPREALNVVRMADHMPGATRLAQMAQLADNMAACVVLISTDLLEDSLFMEALRILLLRNIERSGERLTFIPVVMEPKVKDSNEWNRLDLMLRHYTLLHWRQPYFWERLLTMLPPPPPPSVAGREEALLGAEDAVDSTAHLCIISHEQQVSRHVRCLYERYRRQLNLCHVRHALLFATGAELGALESLSINAVLGTCVQVVVVVSLDLLSDTWTREQLMPALEARVRSLPFRGTVILLEIGTGFAHLCQEPSFAFYHSLRHNGRVVTLAWPDLERNWAHLNVHLLPESVSTDARLMEVAGLDEEEFTAHLMRPVTKLVEAVPGRNVFEQNRMRWAQNSGRSEQK